MINNWTDELTRCAVISCLFFIVTHFTFLYFYYRIIFTDIVGWVTGKAYGPTLNNYLLHLKTEGTGFCRFSKKTTSQLDKVVGCGIMAIKCICATF